MNHRHGEISDTSWLWIPSYSHMNFNYRNKTVVKTSYLYNENTEMRKDILHIETEPCPLWDLLPKLSLCCTWAYQCEDFVFSHYDDVIMTMLASQISSLPVVCSIVYSDVNQRKHQSSASLAFVREIHRGPVNFPHKWPVTRKMFPFDDVIMLCCTVLSGQLLLVSFVLILSMDK